MKASDESATGDQRTIGNLFTQGLRGSFDGDDENGAVLDSGWAVDLDVDDVVKAVAIAAIEKTSIGCEEC